MYHFALFALNLVVLFYIIFLRFYINETFLSGFFEPVKLSLNTPNRPCLLRMGTGTILWCSPLLNSMDSESTLAYYRRSLLECLKMFLEMIIFPPFVSLYPKFGERDIVIDPENLETRKEERRAFHNYGKPNELI